MATVRLDTTTETKLKRLATRRGQNRSEVIRDAIDHLSEGEGRSRRWRDSDPSSGSSTAAAGSCRPQPAGAFGS